MDDQSAPVPVLAEIVEPILQAHWEAIQSKREELVEVLDRMAVGLPKEGAKRLSSLSQWFSRSRRFEEALVRADVLAVCLPLCKTFESQGEVSQLDIASAARGGFCAIGQNSSGSRQLVRALMYPVVVLFAAALVAIGLSVFVIPQFEQMFQEFGIQLPVVTEFFLDCAKVIRKWSFLLVLWPTLALGVIWFLDRLTARRRHDGMGWLDLWTQSSRTALADWAWHISLLLGAGLTQAAAMRQAGRFAGKSWLRQGSRLWARSENSQGSLGNQEVVKPGAPNRYLANPKFQLLDLALAVPKSQGKIQLLREVASYYRDRNRNIGLWWIQWLVALLLWAIGGIVIVVIFSLFAPLISIVSGLV